MKITNKSCIDFSCKYLQYFENFHSLVHLRTLQGAEKRKGWTVDMGGVARGNRNPGNTNTNTTTYRDNCHLGNIKPTTRKKGQLSNKGQLGNIIRDRWY